MDSTDVLLPVVLVLGLSTALYFRYLRK
jgi:hypothetical protein